MITVREGHGTSEGRGDSELSLSGPLQSFPGNLGFVRDLSQDQGEAGVCVRVMQFPEEHTEQAKAHGGQSSVSPRSPLHSGAQGQGRWGQGQGRAECDAEMSLRWPAGVLSWRVLQTSLRKESELHLQSNEGLQSQE